MSAPPSEATTPPANGPPPAAPSSAPTAVEAGGFRLAITAPTAGSSVGTVTTFCYEVTGSSREPLTALDVELLGPDGDVQVGPTRTEVPPGRGRAEVGLTGAAAGTYDLRVQLLDSGAPIAGAVLLIPDITLGNGSEPPPDMSMTTGETSNRTFIVEVDSRMVRS